MENQEFDRTLRESLSGEAPPHVHTWANRHFEALRRAGATARQRFWGRPRFLWWSGLSAAGATAVVVLCVSLFFSSTVSWAQVVARFRALRFFNATIYVSQRTSAPPEKIEIWAAQGPRSRVHYRGLIFFGQDAKVTKVLNSDTGREVDLQELRAKPQDASGRVEYPALHVALGIQEGLGRMRQFSLDGLLGFFRGKRWQLSPVPNLDDTLESDMQVFDFAPKGSPEWLRLWVLKKSELPVRLRSWDPRDGEQVEVLFDYLNDMPDEALDPARVQSAILKRQGRANRLYALLKDPGGRQLTPEDLFANHGYHMPELVSVGRTVEGVLWVLSGNAINRRADGRTLYGFGKLEDDLHQPYVRQLVGHRLAGNNALEYFIPLDYGPAFKRPASYTLTCWDRESGADGRRPETIIGSLPIENWAEGASVPPLFSTSTPPDTNTFLRLLLNELVSRGDWERFERLAELIPGAPEDNPLALHRELQREVMLEQTGDSTKAALLRARLYPLVKGGVDWGTWRVIQRHIVDLFRAGQQEQARALANRHMSEALAMKKRDTSYFAADFLMALKNSAGMNEATLRAFFDQDILSLPAIRTELENRGFFRDLERERERDRRFAEWRDYVANLADRYRTQSLPKHWEFIAEPPVLSSNQLSSPMPLPGHPGYNVTLLDGRVGSARHLAAVLEGVEPELVTVAPAVTNLLKRMVCVYHTNITWQQYWAPYFKDCGIELVKQSTRAKVLVARYDGRKLPNYREVEPMDASQLGAKLLVRAGGTSTSVRTLLDAFQRSLNHGRNLDDTNRILIVDQTGLTSVENKSSRRTPCLAYEYAFWTGPGTDKLAFDWFGTNFGITFQNEDRAMTSMHLRVAGSK